MLILLCENSKQKRFKVTFNLTNMATLTNEIFALLCSALTLRKGSFLDCWQSSALLEVWNNLMRDSLNIQINYLLNYILIY
jgi:hypothetical protein